MKHTRSPWNVGVRMRHNGIEETPIFGDGIQVAATTAVCREEVPMADANARLIAAAPDLLQIVEQVAEMYENTDSPLGIAAREALAKARGEA